MRPIALLAIVVVPSLAAAEPRSPRAVVLDALDIDNPRLAALFAADVQLGAVAFADDRCVERFRADRVRGDDRTALARCVLAMHPDPINGFDDVGQTVVTVSHDSGAVVAFDVKGDRIVAIGPLSPDARDRALPTFLGAPHYEPTEQVQATARKVGRSFSGVMKVCNRADGKVTTRRLARTSGLPALDKEVTTHFATIERVSPRRVRDVPIASCDVFEFSIHGKPPQVLVVKKRRVKELVQPVRVEKRDPSEDGVEGGDENGDVGGDVGGVVGGAPPPPPPPPPPAPTQNVAPAALETQRIAGDKNIVPDDATKQDIADSGKDRVITSWKLCIDTGGAVVSATVLKSSNFPAYDEKIRRGMKTWRYRPFMINGKAVPVCTAVTFIYKQDPPQP